MNRYWFPGFQCVPYPALLTSVRQRGCPTPLGASIESCGRCLSRPGALRAPVPAAGALRDMAMSAAERSSPSHHPFGVLAKDDMRVIAVRVLANKFGAPRKRPYDAIIVAFCVRNLARAHQSSEQIKNSSIWELSKSKKAS